VSYKHRAGPAEIRWKRRLFTQGIEMPTILRVGRYRFFFHSSDRNEPLHIHIEADDNIAKVWLDPIRLENSGGFSRSDIVVGSYQ
jgi:hypothetical protein